MNKFFYYRNHPDNDVIKFVNCFLLLASNIIFLTDSHYFDATEIWQNYYLLLASNSTIMTDSQYLGTTQIWQNLNEHQKNP